MYNFDAERRTQISSKLACITACTRVISTNLGFLLLVAEDMNDFTTSNRLVVLSAWPVAIAGILGLGYAVLRIILAFLDDGSTVYQQTTNPIPGQSSTSNYDISILDQINPFVTSSVQPPETIDIVPDAPETSLDIVLYGVISSENGAGSAILSVFGQPQVLYKVGETIEDTQGAVIHSITGDGVVIERQGQFERISFGENNGDGIVTISPETYLPERESNYAITTILTPPPEQQPETSSSTINQTKPNQASSRPSPASSQTSTRLSRMQIFELASSIRLDGNTGSVGRGMAVYPTRNVRLFDQSGLQPGDIILQIDSIAISSNSDMMSLISQFENKTSVTLLIARGSSRVRHTVTLSD